MSTAIDYDRLSTALMRRLREGDFVPDSVRDAAKAALETERFKKPKTPDQPEQDSRTTKGTKYAKQEATECRRQSQALKAYTGVSNAECCRNEPDRTVTGTPNRLGHVARIHRLETRPPLIHTCGACGIGCDSPVGVLSALVIALFPKR